jgi:maltose alpha-D-glucosyltransferase / alpha-amylase
MLIRWYRNGVIYSADVGLFQDGNDDGIGDFQGMIGRLDYLARRYCTRPGSAASGSCWT